MTGEPPRDDPAGASHSSGVRTYSTIRRTALVLLGEGTSIAYLSGALKALGDAGVRIDVILGRGAGAVVSAFGAVQAVDRLTGPKGLLAKIVDDGVWRLRAPYRMAILCLAGAVAVFLSPALLAVLLLLALPLMAAARIVAPDAMAEIFSGLQELVAESSTQLDPLYLRAMSFPVAILFALLLVGWVLPAILRRQPAVLGEGFVHLAPLARALEGSLWESVRGASTDSRPGHRNEIGERYRELLAANLGRHGFSELVFYALDTETGQEVPFVLLKDRWLNRMRTRGPGSGALVAEPVNLGGEASGQFFDAMMASVSPPGVAPSVPVKLPLGGRYPGEVHHFCSSLLAGQSLVADAVAAGAEQIIYVNGAPPTEIDERWTLERLAAASVRQSLESDLRWATHAGIPVFAVRPEKYRLSLFEFTGRKLPGGDRLSIGSLVAHGERDTHRIFVRPMIGDIEPTPLPAEAPNEDEAGAHLKSPGPPLGSQKAGPRQFD